MIYNKIKCLLYSFFVKSLYWPDIFYHHAWLRRVVCMRTFLQRCILSEKATITSWLGVKNPNCSANFSLKSFNVATHFSSSCSNTSKDTPQRQTATMIVQHFLTCTQWQHQGGLAARSGTEFTWLPQLRNSAEWDWEQIFLENKYGGECRHGRTMSFCSVLSFPAYKYQEKVSMDFSNGPFGHQKAWSMNSSWVTSLIVIRDLGKFSYF